MRTILFIVFLMFLSAMLQSCGLKQQPMVRDDPLIGKIVDTKISTAIDFPELISRILNKDVIYLSEKHDNPAHHRIQTDIIKALIEKGKRPKLGFEFFSMDDTPFLLSFIDSGKADHSKQSLGNMEFMVRRRLGWEHQSDEMWGYYYELLCLARQEGLLVAGIDLNRSQKKRITRKGLKGLTKLEKKMIFSSNLSNEPYKDYMFDIFKLVHCGMENQALQSRLYDTWVARNDKMALSISQMVDREQPGPVVVIIGGGHTEFGLGVIERAKALDSTLTQVNVGLQEIRMDPAARLDDYTRPLDIQGLASVLPADFIWFTQRVSYEDPCEAFKEMLNRGALKK